jgi:O-antigen ligase
MNWESVFLFLFLAIFPFGQIARMNFNFLSFSIPLQPLDVVAGLGGLYSILFQREQPRIFKYLVFLPIAGAFSFILSIHMFNNQSLYGLFYLFRLVFYIFFFRYVWNFAHKDGKNKSLLLSSFLAVSVVSALYGWVQFFVLPDLKPLYYIGWDMHLYRLAGTFLDPTFLGLVIVFGLSISLINLFDTGKKIYYPIIIFLLLSLAFTYARAAYLAFFASLFVVGVYKGKLKKILGLIFVLIILVLILPTAKNKSIELTRTFSIEARIVNYREAIEVFRHEPIFGVGYNNMCVARNMFIGEEPFSSHACSGSDSSLLLILATMGVTGMLIFVLGLYKIFDSVRVSSYGIYAVSCLTGLLVHSLFSNSLFFPWIMGYIGAVLAVSVKN